MLNELGEVLGVGVGLLVEGDEGLEVALEALDHC